MSIVPVCHASGVARFACAQAGCQECQEALLQANEGLIHHVIQQQGIGGLRYEDLVQEGRIAVWRSILHFDPGRGYAFSTYAWTAISQREVWLIFLEKIPPVSLVTSLLPNVDLKKTSNMDK